MANSRARRSRVSHPDHRRRLSVEPLEPRRLLSGMPELAFPWDLVPAGNTRYFTAVDDTTGGELWKSDGTEAGTVLVKDIRPGSESSYPQGLTYVNGTLFFTANDGTTGRELWTSDGTEAGTVLVKDIRPGSDNDHDDDHDHESPGLLTNVNGTLFFGADDGTTGFELWKSDGTEAGTLLVKDIRPGSDGAFLVDDDNDLPSFSPTNVNGTLFFTASDGTTGFELWKSDGTEAGTVLVKDIRPGSDHAFPGNPTNVNGTLFFTANDGTTGYELWKSDGTEAGTVLVKDIRPGIDSAFRKYLTKMNVNGTLFFSAFDGTTGRELWKSDGTEVGTVLVKDIYIEPSSNDNFVGPSNLTNVNGTLFFSRFDGTRGAELWKSDGTEAGTVLVKDIQPGSDGAYPGGLTNVNGTLFFRANDGTTGSELWKSDGTEAGTVLVKDIRPGSGGTLPMNLTNVNGTLLFTAHDGTTGRKLWKLAPMPGDTNFDCVVDVTDLNNVRNNFGRAGNTFPGDTNGDGVVNIDDLNAVRNNFGAVAAGATAGLSSSAVAHLSASNHQTPVAVVASTQENSLRAMDGALNVRQEQLVRRGVFRSARGHLPRAAAAERTAWDIALLDFLAADDRP